MVEDYFHSNYVGKNLIIIGTGGIKHDDFVKQVSEKFGMIK
jgi:predicted Zn-dependent peptidase